MTVMTVTTEQLDEWERLADEAERGRRHNASTSEILAVIQFETAARLAVPQLVDEVRRLRGENALLRDMDRNAGDMICDHVDKVTELEAEIGRLREALNMLYGSRRLVESEAWKEGERLARASLETP